MKRWRKKKAAAALAAVLLFAGLYLFYSRPMTIPQRYEMLTLDKCFEIGGYYHDGTTVDLKKFTVDKNSEEFEKLWELLYERDYRRSLKDLVPRGRRTHRSEPGDFQWDVSFRFEDVIFPDGSTSSGEILRVQNWYGELDIYFAGERLSCHTKDQEAWAKEVLDLIR